MNAKKAHILKIEYMSLFRVYFQFQYDCLDLSMSSPLESFTGHSMKFHGALLERPLSRSYVLPVPIPATLLHIIDQAAGLYLTFYTYVVTIHTKQEIC